MAGIEFIPFLESQRWGAIVVNVFAILCTLALVSVALRVTWLAIRWSLARNAPQPQEYVFFQTQLGNYAACLLIAMTFNTLAGMMGLPWLINNGITQGAFCTAQGFLMQAGTWASAYFTVSIAVHTFNSLVMKKRQSVILSRTTMSIGWAVSILMAAVPFIVPQPDGDVYGADGFLCGLRDAYPKMRFFLHLLPILIASVLSAILYSIIFLVLRGTLHIKGRIRLTLDPKERAMGPLDDNFHRFIARVARSMIWYPVAYVALLVPYSVMRLLEISGFFVPFQAMVFACTCWFALGVVNVLLLYNTFRKLGPAFDAKSFGTIRKDLESWGPSGFLDQEYSTSFRPQKPSGIPEKIPQFHLPRAAYRSSSTDSLDSAAQRTLSSPYGKNYSRQNYSGFGTGPALSPPGDYDSILSSPKPIAHKAEVMAHSPSSSVDSKEHLLSPRRVRTPSPDALPPVDGRIKGYAQPPSSFDFLSGYPLSNPASASASSPKPKHEVSWSPIQEELRVSSPQVRHGVKASTVVPSNSPPSRLPPRQLALLAGSASPTGGWGPSKPQNRGQNQRPLLLSQANSVARTSDLPTAYINPRTPPSPPSIFNVRRLG